ncbi:hypothetical protein TNCT_34691 [Trichonephila clavata]|uniref:Uncharacterized protein n=1 Tax=Trichonephila clavata TaxID=2740835 RepID=A0A8X6FRU8_TRICU|nr:hypothetical protein TNCT_34691 [Trichonephila clavata]
MYSNKKSNNLKLNHPLNTKSRSCPNLYEAIFENIQTPRENFGVFDKKLCSISKSIEFFKFGCKSELRVIKRFETDLLNRKRSLLQKEQLNSDSESKTCSNKSKTFNFSLNDKLTSEKYICDSNNLRGARSCTIVSSGSDNMASGVENIRHDFELSFQERRRRCLSKDPRLRVSLANEPRPGWRSRFRNFFRDIRKQIRNCFARFRTA